MADEQFEKLSEQLQRVERLTLLASKDVFDIDEAVLFTRLSKSTLYKLTSERKIPHYKPNGKTLYFKRDELESWLLQNPVKTVDEIDQQASMFILSKGK